MPFLAVNRKQMDITIHKWIERGKDLPVFPATIVNVLRLTNSPDSNVSQIADFIKRDISLTAAILRITNSPAFSLFSKVTTIDQAIMFLGFKAVRNLAIGLTVLNIFPVNEKYFLSRVWQRSILTALAARELCASAGKKEDAFTIGLLHDIGLLAFYVYDRNKALDILKNAEKTGKMDLDDEKNIFGIDHIQAGSLMAERWKLPDEITLTMTHHHKEPQDDLFDPSGGNLFRVIYLASRAGDIFYLGKKAENIKKFKDGCQRLLGIPAEDSDKLLKDIHPRLVEVAKCLNVAVEPGHTYEDILSSVNNELLNITISNEATMYHMTDAMEREKILAVKLEEANLNLKKMASKDPLTGLFNRQFLNKLLEREWGVSKQYDFPLTVIMADIDNFKTVNDTYGHQAGDMVLKKIAEVLSKNLRKNDYLARYGGEEFIFVLPQTDSIDAYNTAERFIAEVRKAFISLNNNHRLSVTISCGVSTAYPSKKPEKIQALIHRADTALYEAKTSGKDRVVCKEE